MTDNRVPAPDAGEELELRRIINSWVHRMIRLGEMPTLHELSVVPHLFMCPEAEEWHEAQVRAAVLEAVERIEKVNYGEYGPNEWVGKEIDSIRRQYGEKGVSELVAQTVKESSDEIKDARESLKRRYGHPAFEEKVNDVAARMNEDMNGPFPEAVRRKEDK